MGEELTFWACLLGAGIAGVIHTVAGPDHYLPFIVLAKRCKWNHFQTISWTFICGVGHVISALLLVACFFWFGSLLSENQLEWVNEHRSNVAASLLVGLGFTYLIWGIRHAVRNRIHSHEHIHVEKGTSEQHDHEHNHAHSHIHFHEPKCNKPSNLASVTPWILFIIFALGPCEAMLPLLTASAVVGTFCLILTTIIFCSVTIITMMSCVYLGLCGIRAINLQFMDRYSHVLGGMAIMFCGFAVLFLGW
ncbi:MAG: hypothetical protein ACRCUY_07575 [Thermoguttaceae bacterium]